MEFYILFRLISIHRTDNHTILYRLHAICFRHGQLIHMVINNKNPKNLFKIQQA